MSLRRFALTAAVVLAALAPSGAADPAVEVRLQSIDALLARAEYLGGLAGKGEEAKQFAGIAKAFTNEKGLEGIDPTKEFGFYASITPDVVDSPLVLMVPVKDEDAFIGLFTNKLGMTPKKGDGGVYSLDVPMAPKPVYFRFANGYAYGTFGDAKHIEKAGLIAPEKFFAASRKDALAAVTVHVNRIPDELKKVFLGQVELKMAEEKAKKKPNETPPEQMFRELAMDGVMAAIKAGTFEAERIEFSITVEPKSDDLGIDLTVTPKPGTPLAKSLAANAARPGVAARLKGAGLANFTAVKLAVPDDGLATLGKIADAVAAQAVADANPEAKELAKEAVDAALATLRKGDLDFGFATSRPRADGTVGMTAVLKIAKGKDVEAVLKKAAVFAPADEAVFTFDTAKLGGADLHKVEIKGPGATKVKALTGSDTIWFAIGEELAVVGTDEAAVKAAVAATAGPVAALSSDTAIASIMAIPLKLDPEPAIAQAVKTAFGDSPAGNDSINLSVETGDRLALKVRLKGTVLSFFRLMDEAKAK